MSEGQTPSGSLEELNYGLHIRELKELFTHKVFAELNDDRTVYFGRRCPVGARSPTMGKVRAEQDKVSGLVVGDSVADESLAGAVGDECELVFGMEMPGKREFRIGALKGKKRAMGFSNPLKLGSHEGDSSPNLPVFSSP
jgi:hypothetical protein